MGTNSADSLQSLKQNIPKLNALINQLENIQQQIGTAKDTPELRTRVLNIQSNAKALLEASQKNLKELNNVGVSGDLKIQKEKLTDELFKLMRKLQLISQSVLAKEKETEGVKQNRGFNNFDDDIPVRFSKDEQKFGQQTQVEKDDLSAVKERKKQFDQLETDIRDLNSMFKDLAVMVHDQGQDIDAIERNIESSEMAVGAANTQLVEATQYQSKARRKKLIILLIIFVVLIIIVTVVILSLKPWNW